MKLNDLKAGDTVRTDEGFTCMDKGNHVVHVDDEGPFLECRDGKHYLDGQRGDDGHLIGILPA